MSRSLRRGALRLRRASGALPQARVAGADALLAELKPRLAELSAREKRAPSIWADPSSYGGDFQRERIRLVAEHCLREYAGDIVEIGCFQGDTTRILAEVAAAAGRRVMAVDPWLPGTQNCSGTEYDAFLESIKDFRSVVDVVRLSSLCAEAISQIRSRPLCMAYVDGLHTYEAALSDIRSVSHCAGLVIVDDVGYNCEVMWAMHQGAIELRRTAVHLPPAKEGYLVAK